MKALRTALLTAVTIALPSFAAAADGVVVSIKPIHSLVAGVMQGVGSPHLIVKGGGSPHTYSLKPLDADALENARVVFWIGRELESFLEGSIKSLSSKARVVALEDVHDMVRLKFREGSTFDSHDDHDEDAHEEGHDDHGDEKHAKAGHDDDGHKDEAKAGQDHDGHKDEARSGEGHGDHGEVNPHLWLDPRNAKAMVREIEEALVKADPANAAAYKANAEALGKRLDALTGELTELVAPLKDRSFVVFHDAYPYFENRFGVKAAGSITVSPEKLPGAKRLKEIRAKVKDLGATCVFSEPQFEPRLAAVVTEGTEAKAGVLDPLGADIKDGPDLYFTLLRNMAESMKTCLSPSS